MTLGGLALAVGILVDEATVTIENIHTHLARGQTSRWPHATRRRETTVPRLLAMLCILAVFIPAFFMQGAAATTCSCPLALAVGFSMVASYLLSSTLVPVLSVWLLRQHRAQRARSIQAASSTAFATATRRFARRHRRAAMGRRPDLSHRGRRCHLTLSAATLGREIFPVVDAGQFELRLRAPAGTRIEKTEQLAQQTLDVISTRSRRRDNVADLASGYVGVQPGAYPVNTIHLWTSGPEEAVLQVQLKPGASRASRI